MPLYQVRSRLRANGASLALGDHKSALRIGKKKDAGITPTIGTEEEPKRSVFPMTFGSALKRRRQNLSLISIAGGPPKCSSPGAKSLPIAGAIPHTWRKRAATNTRVRRSGSSPESSE